MAEEIPSLFSAKNRTIPVLVVHGDKTLRRRRGNRGQELPKEEAEDHTKNRRSRQQDETVPGVTGGVDMSVPKREECRCRISKSLSTSDSPLHIEGGRCIGHLNNACVCCRDNRSDGISSTDKVDEDIEVITSDGADVNGSRGMSAFCSRTRLRGSAGEAWKRGELEIANPDDFAENILQPSLSKINTGGRGCVDNGVGDSEGKGNRCNVEHGKLDVSAGRGRKPLTEDYFVTREGPRVKLSPERRYRMKQEGRLHRTEDWKMLMSGEVQLEKVPITLGSAMRLRILCDKVTGRFNGRLYGRVCLHIALYNSYTTWTQIGKILVFISNGRWASRP